MKKYKNTNIFEQPIKAGNLVFQPKETKILDYKIDGFHVEEIEETEKPKKIERRK